MSSKIYWIEGDDRFFPTAEALADFVENHSGWSKLDYEGETVREAIICNTYKIKFVGKKVLLSS